MNILGFKIKERDIKKAYKVARVVTPIALDIAEEFLPQPARTFSRVARKKKRKRK